jgi:hypothetical protein
MCDILDFYDQVNYYVANKKVPLEKVQVKVVMYADFVVIVMSVM